MLSSCHICCVPSFFTRKTGFFCPSLTAACVKGLDKANSWYDQVRLYFSMGISIEGLLEDRVHPMLTVKFLFIQNSVRTWLDRESVTSPNIEASMG